MPANFAGGGANGNNRRSVDLFRLVETLIGRISRCEILNNGVITRNRMPANFAGGGANGNNRRSADLFRLVETLIGRISRCEILNNGVIITTRYVRKGAF